MVIKILTLIIVYFHLAGGTAKYYKHFALPKYTKDNYTGYLANQVPQNRLNKQEIAHNRIHKAQKSHGHVPGSHNHPYIGGGGRPLPHGGSRGTGKPDLCYLVPEVGYGRGRFPRYFYDEASQSCHTFFYGGVGGNPNNFHTLEECENTCATRGPNIKEGKKVVAGYVPFWPTLNLSVVEPSSITHLLYAFIELDTLGNLKYSTSDLAALATYKNLHPEIEIVPSIGGATYSWAFSSLADPEVMRNFIENSVKLVDTYRLDGLDIDWEYPNEAQKGIYAEMLVQLREALPSKTLMSAVPAGFQNFGGFDTSIMNSELDYVGVMTYDFHGGWEPYTGHNAPHFGIPSDPYTTEKSIELWIEEGLDPSIILVGLPFYGRERQLSGSQHGVGAPALPGVENIVPYKNMQLSGWNLEFDEVAKVPYAHKGTNWLSYDDVWSIVRKTQWACEQGYAGVMAWELSQDKSMELSLAIASVDDTTCAGEIVTVTTGAPTETTPSDCPSDPFEICRGSGPEHRQYPPDCHKYVECLTHNVMECPPDLVFNPLLEACDWEISTPCNEC